MRDGKRVRVIGAGLAGCEAAWQLARRGVGVLLSEMKPNSFSPAHSSEAFGELVCSNSLRSDSVQNAAGLLKEEMRRLGSLVIRAADENRVPAGSALAVDREGFSRTLTDVLTRHPLVTTERAEVTRIDTDTPTIVATGPLSSEALGAHLSRLLGRERLSFYDAAAPIVFRASLDMQRLFFASRYGKGSDYLNCAMTREEYEAFCHELVHAATAEVHGFEEKRVFEGCMPIESMARRGLMTLAYGPLKPVGLKDPRTGKRPFAVVQLRQDDREGYLYNLVGFQTRLLFPEQRRVFRMIPGLEKAEFARYGRMHRNTYIASPGLLGPDYRLLKHPGVYFAGQITGVEGYVESAASGLVAGVSMACRVLGEEPPVFGADTALGALGHYVSGYAGSDFQPMNISFGIIKPPEIPIKSKRARHALIAERALAAVESIGDRLRIAGHETGTEERHV